MSAKNKELGPGRSRPFSPFLSPGQHEEFQGHIRFTGAALPGFADEMRALSRRYVDDGDSLKLRAVCLLAADLFDQGWHVATAGGAVSFSPPGIALGGNETVEDIKARVRHTLQTARARQLAEPSVRKFLERMEHRSSRGNHRSSIVDLIDDGAAIAVQLDRIRKLGGDAEKEHALAELIDPVVEICHAGKRCADTGLLLIDIWRYFRHTWAHEYRSIPGRQMLVLIRNARRPNRPVMGIAMLASPVMRLTARDQWIGWLTDAAQQRVTSGEWSATDLAAALLDRLDASIADVRWDDLATPSEISRPTEVVALRLEQRAAGAAFARDAELRAHFELSRVQGEEVRPHRGALRSASPDADWMAASEDLLFVRKRAETLAKLVFAKQVFRTVNLKRWPEQGMHRLFASKDGRRALDIVMAEFRKAGLSSELADVSICGAAHPYNELLGGKLVALLLASREVRDAYSSRYDGQISVIASQMAGRPITKPATLRMITTTSLYGVGSSQYNRLVVRAHEHPGLPFDIKWQAIGKSLTEGFGTLHLGRETAQALQRMAFARHDARRVNNRFGEGTSPRLRQIREGLDALGIKSDSILNHGTPRIFYGCELNPGARKMLVGLGGSAADIPSCATIAAAWRRRWVLRRGARDETLAALRGLGPTSVRASLHADSDGQFLLPMID